MYDRAVSSPVVTTTDSDGVACVTLDRPEAMNAITIALATELEAALRAAGADPDVRAILLRGAGEHFCVGGDFKELMRLKDEGREAMRRLFEAFGAACAAIADVPVPVVAAVHGNAMAGGFELMQAADIALVADDARLSDNHLNFAMIPGGGGSQRLPRIVGRQRALAHILTGERLTGTQAADLGLALRAVPAPDLDAAARELCATLAGKDRVALARAKQLVVDGLALPLADGLAMERTAVVDHIAGDGSMDAFTAKTDTRSTS